MPKILVSSNPVHNPIANVDGKGTVFVTPTNNPPTNGSPVTIVNKDGTTATAVWTGTATR
jgi:hypothetical protein